MYFYYGIKHSSLEEEQEDDAQNIELSVTTDITVQPPSAGPETKMKPQVDPFVTSWDDDYSNSQSQSRTPADTTPQAPAPTSSLNVSGRNPLFVSTSQFPTWDD